jgi:hypothetical protein
MRKLDDASGAGALGETNPPRASLFADKLEAAAQVDFYKH